MCMRIFSLSTRVPDIELEGIFDPRVRPRMGLKDLSRVQPSIPIDQLTCPKCDNTVASIVALYCTEKTVNPFTDAAGVHHDHDTNSHCAEAVCQEGHRAWIKIDAPECNAKCGFGSRLGTILHRVQ